MVLTMRSNQTEAKAEQLLAPTSAQTPTRGILCAEWKPVCLPGASGRMVTSTTPAVSIATASHRCLVRLRLRLRARARARARARLRARARVRVIVSVSVRVRVRVKSRVRVT